MDSVKRRPGVLEKPDADSAAPPVSLGGLDAVCNHFEAAWRDGQRPRIEQYLKEAAAQAQKGGEPNFTREELFRNLLYGELHFREKRGEPTSMEDYLQRFPDYATLVRDVLGNAETVGLTWGPARKPNAGANAPLSAHELARRLDSLDMIDAEELQGQLESVAPDQRPQDATGLARLLVEREKLTAYQAEVLLHDKNEPLVVGEYFILEKLGEGGMGQVFKARHRELNRVVALKWLRPHVTGNPEAVRRFLLEMKAAASLEHDNIVRVYETGEDEGRHYFTMQYVNGRSLDGLLRDGPPPHESAARYISAAARGIAKAHQQGIFHRDLKPHNILIEEENDRALVADFGLAKLVGEDGKTETGDVLGTLSYMSPEQAGGDLDALCPATDVYGLGATLYHLLTGVPPFQSSHPVATLGQVMDADAIPPRRRNRAIDRDLETICLKCLEKEPSRRYDSPQQLAQELDRYLNGEPVQARPVGRLQRAWRRAKRNPRLAAAISTAVVFLMVAVALYFLKPQPNLPAVVDFAREELAAFEQRVSPYLPQVELHEQESIGRVVAMLEEVLEHDYENAPDVQELVAQGRYFLGVAQEALGKYEEAAAEYRQAGQLQQGLLERASAKLQPALRRQLADTHLALGRTFHRQRELGLAQIAYLKSLDDRHPVDSDVASQRKLADNHMGLGLLGFEGDDADKALGHYEHAQRILDKLDARREVEVLRAWANNHYNMGNLALEKRKQPGQAKQHFQQARDAFARFKDDLPAIFFLGVTLRRLADCEFDLKRTPQALENYDLSRKQLEKAHQRIPNDGGVKGELAETFMGLGQTHCMSGRMNEGLEFFRRARDIWRSVTESPHGYPAGAAHARQRLKYTELMMENVEQHLDKTGREPDSS